MKRVPARWLAIGYALTLASCGGTTGGSTAPSGPSSVAGVVDEFLEFADSPELLAVRAAEAQNLIVACMAERGFQAERGPQRPAELMGGNESTLPGWNLLVLSLDEARVDGLGLIPNQRSEMESLGFDPDSSIIMEPNLDGDPETVSSEEFAFDVALYGSVIDPEAESSSPATTGCYELAIQEVGPLSLGEATRLIDVETEFEKFSRMMADPEVRQIGKDWQLCMADASYTGVPDPFNQGEFENYFWDDLVANRIEAASSLDPRDMDPRVLEQVQQLETDLAVAFVTCVLPHRPVLSQKWDEYLSFNYD